MSANYADMLAARYIQKLEENSKIVTVMSLFDTKKDGFAAMKNLADASMENVSLNYTTLSAYSREINYAHA